jgi:ketosteroid isomerase-like protein
MVSMLTLVGCTPNSVDTDAEVASLRAAAEAYHAAASAKQSDRVVEMYDTAPLMVPPNAPLVEGLSAVENYRFGFIETPGVSLEFEILRAEVSEAGDMGWTLARGDITITGADGMIGEDEVRDFHVWKKQPDGSWAVVVDIWNSGIPAGD